MSRLPRRIAGLYGSSETVRLLGACDAETCTRPAREYRGQSTLRLLGTSDTETGFDLRENFAARNSATAARGLQRRDASLRMTDAVAAGINVTAARGL